MDDTVDLLKIKIEKAKRDLPLETVNAIDAVDWRAAILELRSKKGYTFEQLGSLELETELLLSELISPESYPKEISDRMEISKAAANELVNEMNESVFKKIREELVKNMDRKKIFANNVSPDKEKSEGFTTKNDGDVLGKAGIKILGKEQPLELEAPEEVALPKREEMLKKIEKPEAVHPILAEKLSSPVQTPLVKTEHTLDNITKTNMPNPADIKNKTPSVDPYREVPE